MVARNHYQKDGENCAIRKMGIVIITIKKQRKKVGIVLNDFVQEEVICVYVCRMYIYNMCICIFYKIKPGIFYEIYNYIYILKHSHEWFPSAIRTCFTSFKPLINTTCMKNMSTPRYLLAS